MQKKSVKPYLIFRGGGRDAFRCLMKEGGGGGMPYEGGNGGLKIGKTAIYVMNVPDKRGISEILYQILFIYDSFQEKKVVYTAMRKFFDEFFTLNLILCQKLTSVH